MKKKIIRAAVIALLAVIVAANCFTVIPTGYTGVRSTFGQISNEIVPNGINFHIPFVQSIQRVNNKQQDITFDSKIWSETLERTAIYYENVTVTYQINPTKAAWIFANVTDYQDALVSRSLVASAIKTASKTLPSTDATNRGIIEPAAMVAIQKSLDEKYGTETVCVNKVVIDNADFEESYNQVIAEKQTAQIEYEKQQIENRKKIEAAEAEARVRVAQAEADAEAMKIRAEAEAEANRLLEQSLTDDILQVRLIEKWNGQLPAVTGSGSTMLDISSIVPEGTGN